MSRPNVLKARPQGFARSWARALAFVAAALLPVTLMGVTVPSAVAVRDAQLAMDDSADRHEERNRLIKRLRGYGKRGMIEELEALERVVRELVPTDLDRLEIFGRLRAAAELHGIELTTIRLVRTHDSGTRRDGAEADGSALVVDEVLISMNDSIVDAFSLVDDMRAGGLPTLVLGFDFTRESVLSPEFQTELRLGFLRRVRLDPVAGVPDER